MDIEASGNDLMCLLCPRQCGAPRTPDLPGWCGSDEGLNDYRVASMMPHPGEETCISGTRGSGTVFFSGCSLKCCFCQNDELSHGHRGRKLTADQLIEGMIRLLALGVHNLNLVTPSHYADRLPDTLFRLRQTEAWKINPVPVIWNSSAYETPESLMPLADTISVYLADMKFFDPNLADDLAAAPDYADIALAAIREMCRQQPQAAFDHQGLIRQGVVIRHLVLPGHVSDSMRILRELARIVPSDCPLSLMKQYRPQTGQPCGRHPEMNRRLHESEYGRVIEAAKTLGFTTILTQ